MFITRPAAVERFGLDLTASGPLKPGVPIRIDLMMTQLRHTPAARLRLFAPELARQQSEKSGRWRAGHVNEISPILDLVTAGAPGSQVSRHAEIIFPEAGYYQVVVSATNISKEQSARGQREGRRAVRDEAVRSLWLWVDELGGHVTPDFDPETLPDSVARMVGPRIVVPGASASSSAQQAMGTMPDRVAMRSLVPTSTVSALATESMVAWNYWDSQAGVVRPIPQAYYEVRRYGSSTLLRSGNMGNDGIHYVPCMPNENPGGYFAVQMYFDKADYGKVNPTDQSTVLIPGNGCSGAVSSVSTGRPASARVFENLIRTVEGSRAAFGPVYRRGHVTVDIDPGLGFSGVYRDDLVVSDRILIGSGIYGDEGLFTMGEEYGHAWNNKGAGPMLRASGDCDAGTIQSYACAWVEAVGNFHAAVAVGHLSQGGSFFPFVTRNADLTSSNPAAQAFNEGRSEYINAAWLYDLWDGYTASELSEPWDTIQLPGSFLAHSLQSCRFLYGSAGSVTAAVDEFRVCLEQTTQAQSYLPGRTVSNFIGYNNGVPSKPAWNTAAFHTLWRHSLFLNP